MCFSLSKKKIIDQIKVPKTGKKILLGYYESQENEEIMNDEEILKFCKEIHGSAIYKEKNFSKPSFEILQFAFKLSENNPVPINNQPCLIM